MGTDSGFKKVRGQAAFKRQNMRRDVHRRSAYPFQIFQSHQQGLYAGVSGSVGQEEGNRHCGHRGLHPSGLAGTIEFFPEEGKYHLDGHRKCGLCISPQETAGYGGRCPVCGKKITIGVLNRIEQLADADREEGFLLPSGRPFESLAPLPEVIGASMGISPAGKKAVEKYEQMIGALGPEFVILREVPVEDIRKAAGPLVAEGIRRLRDGRVEHTPGYDGKYGKIGLLTPEDISSLEGQMSFFTAQELYAMDKEQRNLSAERNPPPSCGRFRRNTENGRGRRERKRRACRRSR